MSTEETVLLSQSPARPNPGGRLTLVSSTTSSAPTADRFWETLALDRPSPLVAAAAPLLGLCAQLKNSTSHADVEGLRLRVLREIDGFERRITPLGLAPRAIKASKYALCATIDDIVLNTPWGSRSVWTTRSMVGSLFSETWGGDRFFDLLTQLKKDPGVNVELLELLYYCMSLGFEGRFRIASRGSSELGVLREDVYRLIRAARGDFERDISPHWRGTAIGRKLLRNLVPSWVIAACCAALLLALYAGLLFALNARSDRIFDDLATLPPVGAVSLTRIATPPPPPVIEMRGDRLRRFLEPEIREGLVTVTEDAQQIVVTIRGAGMFDSASPTVKRQFEPLLLRIGDALNDQPGAVLLTGHTDSTPIRSVAFPSNYHLSLARAKTVGGIITSKMNDPERVREEGRGDAEPVASNDTPEGRQQNRRTEIIISKTN